MGTVAPVAGPIAVDELGEAAARRRERWPPFVACGALAVAIAAAAVLREQPAALLAWSVAPWCLAVAARVARSVARRRLQRNAYVALVDYEHDRWRARHLGRVGRDLVRCGVAWAAVGVAWWPVHEALLRS